MPAEFQYFATILFCGFVLTNGLRGILRREMIFTYGRGKGGLDITLRGNYAVGGGVGMVVAGLLFAFPVVTRNQDPSFATLDGIFFAAGFGILIASLVLAAIFQWAVSLGRDLDRQPTQEE